MNYSVRTLYTRIHYRSSNEECLNTRKEAKKNSGTKQTLFAIEHIL